MQMMSPGWNSQRVVWVVAFLASCSRPGTEPTHTNRTQPAAEAQPSQVAQSHPAPSASLVPPAPSLSISSLRGGGDRSVGGTAGVVVSVEDQATRAGVEILEHGGNAVDAAVAVAYALAVTHPSAGNIGGGGFMLIHRAGEATVALDFRETAPAALTQARFDAMIRAGARGPAAVGVPGSVAGLNLALSRFGRLQRAAVMEPAIRLAQSGHTLGKQQARALSWAWGILKQDPEARRLFSSGAGSKPAAPKQAGQRLVQTDLANTLQAISERGDAGFYEGPVADAIVRAMGRVGLITHTDLKQYRAMWRVPLHFPYRDVEVEVMPPPSAGGVALTQTLLTRAKLAPEPVPLNSVDSWHQLIEIARRTHSLRRFEVTDPDSPGYDDAARRARWLDAQTTLDATPAIDPIRATASQKIHPLYGAAMRELEHTTHFSVVDGQGSVVSCTMTLSAGYGAGFVVPGAGVVLNNSVAAFGTVGDSTPAPGRRTTSSMTPTLLLQQDHPVAVLGSPGGDTIPNTIAEVIVNLVDSHMLLEDAVDAPRVHHGFVPDEVRVELEHPLPEAIQKALRAKGHKLIRRRVIGDANSIVLRWSDGAPQAFGYADPREGGLALAAKTAAP